jgi:putative phage-type endonuclease
VITLDVEQGSEEWHQARVGLPTASSFSEIITTKGEKSTSAKKLMYRLAGEKAIGHAEESYSNGAMQRGIELEPEARALFELITDLEVSQTGLVYLDDRKDRACSPDGLIVGESAGLEIKCPKLETHVGYLFDGKLPTTYFAQVQGSMYITGHDRWHFFSYYPGLKPFHLIVERDLTWCVKLDQALNNFIDDLNEVYKTIKGE